MPVISEPVVVCDVADVSAGDGELLKVAGRGDWCDRPAPDVPGFGIGAANHASALAPRRMQPHAARFAWHFGVCGSVLEVARVQGEPAALCVLCDRDPVALADVHRRLHDGAAEL